MAPQPVAAAAREAAMDRKRLVIAGTNFAGYTAALELKELVGDNHDVIVVANTHKFVFFPSLIWYPFGRREEKDVTFDVRPELAADCIDEWLELAVAVNSDFAGRVALLATDEELGGRGDWTIGGGTWTRSSGVADVTLTGTVRDLLLVTARRCTPAEAGVDVSGDVELLATWLDGMKF